MENTPRYDFVGHELRILTSERPSTFALRNILITLVRIQALSRRYRPRRNCIRDLRSSGSKAEPAGARATPATRQSVRRTRLTTMRDEEPPMPPPSPAPPSRLRRTLHTLRSPFRSGSPFHIGSLKRSGSGKSSASDGEIVRDERTMRKRNKKHRDAASEASRSTDSSPSVDKKKKDTAGGSLLRRMGSIGRKKPEGSPVPIPPPQPETAESSLEKAPTPPLAELEAFTSEQRVSPIAVEHPVATRPFTKAAWKRKSSEPEMEKPIEPVEEPSPDSALRRRIAFVAQASACFSEDHDDGEERGEKEVGSLEEAVALARVRLGVAARTPSPAHSRDDVDTEEEGYADAMPPYGDLIEPDSNPEPGSDGAAAAAPVSVARGSDAWGRGAAGLRAAVAVGSPCDARAP